MLHVEVVTPTGCLLDRQVDEVVIPGIHGEIGILCGHIPYLTTIRAGVLTCRAKNAAERFAVGGGYAEVGAGDHVLVLADQGIASRDVDLSEARNALDEAETRLRLWSGSIIRADGSTDPQYRDLLASVAWLRATVDIVVDRR